MAATMPPPDRPGVIAPPPVIAAATILGGLLLDHLLPLGAVAGMNLVLRWLLVLAFCIEGGVLGFRAIRAFRAVGTNVEPWKPALALATGNVYAKTRNPMYQALGLIVVGIALAIGSDWTLGLLIPAAFVIHHGVVLREEAYLEARFGDAYRDFRARVPRYGWPY